VGHCIVDVIINAGEAQIVQDGAVLPSSLLSAYFFFQQVGIAAYFSLTCVDC
jgi:hypothetical protein